MSNGVVSCEAIGRGRASTRYCLSVILEICSVLKVCAPRHSCVPPGCVSKHSGVNTFLFSSNSKLAQVKPNECREPLLVTGINVRSAMLFVLHGAGCGQRRQHDDYCSGAQRAAGWPRRPEVYNTRAYRGLSACQPQVDMEDAFRGLTPEQQSSISNKLGADYMTAVLTSRPQGRTLGQAPWSF
jgi:hypothetical protein